MGNVRCFPPLMMKLNHLLLTVLLLSTASELSLLDTTGLSRTPFFFLYRETVFAFLLWESLSLQAMSDFGSTTSQQGRNTLGQILADVPEVSHLKRLGSTLRNGSRIL